MSPLRAYEANEVKRTARGDRDEAGTYLALLKGQGFGRERVEYGAGGT